MTTRTFQGMLFATAAGAAMLTAASAEAAFCVANGVDYDWKGISATSTDTTCAQDENAVGVDGVNTTSVGVSKVTLTGFNNIEMLGLVMGINDPDDLLTGTALDPPPTTQPQPDDINSLKIAVGEAPDETFINVPIHQTQVDRRNGGNPPIRGIA